MSNTYVGLKMQVSFYYKVLNVENTNFIGINPPRGRSLCRFISYSKRFRERIFIIPKTSSEKIKRDLNPNNTGHF